MHPDAVIYEDNGLQQYITFPGGAVTVAAEREPPPFGPPHVVLRIHAVNIGDNELVVARFVLGAVGDVMKVKNPLRLEPEDPWLNDDGSFGAWIDLTKREGDVYIRHIKPPCITTGRQTFGALMDDLLGPKL
jgi:hypothetical protein